MKVLQINTVYGEGSTGKIALSIHDACNKQDIMCLTAHRARQNKQFFLRDSIAIGSKWDSRIHGWISWYTMFKGTGSYFSTLRFLKQVEKYAPDLIHLHNLHGSYVHIPLLFRYIRKHKIPVVWTLHDCWAFTAICSHFLVAGCDKWKSGCHHCPQRKRFSAAPIDFTKQVWNGKRQWFGGYTELTLVAPSNWLRGLVKESFLKEYPVTTIYNGIDLEVFQYRESDFRNKYNLEDRKIVLGVAFDWSYEKGLDVFTDLAKRLDSSYQIVLVGTNSETDRLLPNNIISIRRTHNQQELAELYSVADVFVNPTREEVLGLVNIEALACGTPVITFRTGGSPECVDSSCGVVVDVNDIEGLEYEIHRVCLDKPYDRMACRQRALTFDKSSRIEEYIDLYNSILQN